MADDADWASTLAEREIEHAIETRERPPEGEGAEHCEDEECGVEMPPARRAFGARLCVECQARVERAAAR